MDKENTKKDQNSGLEDTQYIEEIVSPVQPVRRSPIILDAALILTALVVFVVVMSYKVIFPLNEDHEEEVGRLDQAQELTIEDLTLPEDAQEVEVVEPSPIPKISSISTSDEYLRDVSVVAEASSDESVSKNSIVGSKSNVLSANVVKTETLTLASGVSLLKRSDEVFLQENSPYQHFSLVENKTNIVRYEIFVFPDLSLTQDNLYEILGLARGAGTVKTVMYQNNQAYEVKMANSTVLAVPKDNLVYYFVDFQNNLFDRQVVLP